MMLEEEVFEPIEDETTEDILTWPKAIVALTLSITLAALAIFLVGSALHYYIEILKWLDLF